MPEVRKSSSACQETQPIDSLPSSPSVSGEDKDCLPEKCGDELASMQDTQPFEDDAWISDQYMDTQVMDIESDNYEFLLCGETQALDLGFETQVEGTQLLEASDGFATQVLDHFGDEVAADTDDDDVTDVLEDNNELSHIDVSHSRDGNPLSSEDSRHQANEEIKSIDAPGAQSNEHGISGRVARLASVRSAAFRASALAARAASQKLSNKHGSTPVNCHSSGQGATHNTILKNGVVGVGNQQYLPSISVEKGNKTARKLFLEDLPEENCPSVNHNAGMENLSYIDSQEPGEASQASAFNLVDKLISESCLEFGFQVETDCGKRTDEIPKSVPSVKGPQELAKRLSYTSGAVGNGTFDWDNNREDEGGGDIYRRRKEELYGISSKKRETSTLLREQKRELGVAGNKGKAHSDSRLLQDRVTKSRRKVQTAKKNLVKELDEAVGADTQVAAEAIDALCSGDRGNIDAEASREKKLSPGEERGFSNDGVINRKSKGTKRIQAMDEDEFLKIRMNKASPSPAKSCRKRRDVQSVSRKTKKSLVEELDEVSEERTRMFDRREEVDAGPDTQMAAEAINALQSGEGKEVDPELNCLTGKKPSPEGGVSSHGVVTRRSKRLKGIQAVDSDVDSLKPKTKKARSNLDKAFENDKLDTPDDVVVSSTVKRRGELSKKRCTSKPLEQSSRGEANVSTYPKKRRSARVLKDEVNEKGKSSDPAFDTPVRSKMPPKNGSPICMGDEYHRLSCKNSFKSKTTREFLSLTSPSVEPFPETKITRKRRDLSSIRVLFSQHLDEDVTKHQKKILARFNISEASSMTEATHFIADNFMRTRNMLEAIASGKPVVTTQWLESIDQVKIYVDEDLYLLRDSKKEKEFGFNMGVSLARARQLPLLQGRRVFITPNTKPGLNTITTLVKAVHGLPVERLGRSILSEDKVPENLLVLSCEEDRNICIPLLEKGAEVYSSELLLHGIVTQKLEYERYRLFTEHVRKTRSTIWIRDGKGEFYRRNGVKEKM